MTSPSPSPSIASPGPAAKKTKAMELQGKVTIVTGATSGIGLAIAKAFFEKGATLVVTGSRSESDALPALNEISSGNKAAVAYCQADMTRPEEAANKIIQFTLEKFGRVEILINNAGIQHVSPLESFPVEKWNEVMDVNLNSCFHLIRLSIPLMKRNPDRWGRIVNISSVHGVVASVNKAAYVTAKHGLNGLTKVVALETAADTAITCNSICPGFVFTPLVQKQIETRAQQKGISFEAATLDLVGEKQPSKRFTTPEQIADMAIFLCSESASNLTGAVQIMDGAWTVQ